jgi:Dolichyl-phosphate-mannose-protein mannosyltransferase
VKSALLAIASSLLLIVTVAFTARAIFAWSQERKIPREALAVVPFAQETGNIAYALATGKGFTSPFRNNTGPTAWLVPVYPLLLAGIFRIFGPLNIPALNTAIFLNIACSTAACVPIFFVGKRLGGTPLAATAAWMWALFPAAIMLPFEWIWDTSLSALLTALLLWTTIQVADSSKTRDWSLYGALWGFSLMSNAALGSLFLPFLGWAAYRSLIRRRDTASQTSSPALETPQQNPIVPPAISPLTLHAWRRPALAGAVALLCCVPWTIRNYIQFHKLIPLRSNFSFELWSGNNNIFDPHTGNAMARITLYGEVRQYTLLGETAFMQDKWRKATLFIRTHPQLEMKLFLARVISTWLGTQNPGADFIRSDSWLARIIFLVNAFVLIGTLAGVVLLYRRRSPCAFLLACVPVVFPIVYYITHTSLRYRHPLDPVLLLLTAFAITAPFHPDSPNDSPNKPSNMPQLS